MPTHGRAMRLKIPWLRVRIPSSPLISRRIPTGRETGFRNQVLSVRITSTAL